MEWRHRGSPCRKNSECKNPLGNFSPRFSGIKTPSFSLIIFQRAKISRRSITYLCWFNWKTFLKEKRRPREGYQGGLFHVWQCPGSPGNWNPEETVLRGLTVFWSPTLFSGSGPVGLPPVPWNEKTIDRSPFFVQRGSHCCRGYLVRRTNFRFFLSGLQKLDQGLRSVLSFVGNILNKSRVCSL